MTGALGAPELASRSRARSSGKSLAGLAAVDRAAGIEVRPERRSVWSSIKSECSWFRSRTGHRKIDLAEMGPGDRMANRVLVDLVCRTRGRRLAPSAGAQTAPSLLRTEIVRA
jgi:hypothetical protein